MTGCDGDIDIVKQRLKAVSSLPENQLCCDCGDKRPTWASLIVPPDGYAPDDPISKLIIGGFCCFQCSGIHRSLGTHICFVRSLTLDEWKEKEVRALEIGGNTKVNSVFEAKDMSRGRLNRDGETVPIKPNSHSNMTDRKRFIEEKYVEKKYFNAFYYDQIIKSAVDNDMHHQHKMPTIMPPRNKIGQQKKLVEDFDHSFDADWGDAFNNHNNEKEDEDAYDEFGGDGLEEEEPTTSSTTEENEHNLSDMIGTETPLEVREGYDERSGRSRSSGGGSHRSRSNSRSRSKSRSRQPRGGKKRRPGRNGVDPDQDVDSISTSNHSLSNHLAQGGTSASSSSYNSMRPSRCKSDPLSSSEHGKSRLSARRKADPLSASEHGEGRPPTRGSNDPLGSSGHGSRPSRTRINKDPLAVSERGRPRGGGRAAMLRQRSEVIRGGGMIQLGGDLNDGSDRPPRCNSSGSSSNDLLSLSSHGGGGRGPSQRRSNTSLDSLARSEHSGTSGSVRTAPGPGGRMQMMRRQPSRTSLSNTKWSVPNDDKEEEMVHVVQNPMSITSEPIPSAAPKKLHGGGASLFGTKTNNRRSQMHRQGSERIRSKNLVVEEEVDLPIKTRRGPPARSKSDCRRSMMQRAGSTRMRSNVQKRQTVDTKALFLERQARKNALKKTAGTDNNNEEEEENDDIDQSEFGGQDHGNDDDEFVHEVVASDEVDSNSDEDSDIDDDDDDYGDDDEKAVKGGRASRSRGGGGGGGCDGGISSDRRARSMERARGRQQKKVAAEPDEADEQDESDQAEESEEKKPKGTFEFGTRRKTKPRRHDSSSSAISDALRTSTHNTNRRRRPPQSSSAGSNSRRPTRHNSKTSTSSSRDSEDSHSGRPSRHNSKTSTTSSRDSEDSHSGRPSRHNSKTSTTSSRDNEDSHSGRPSRHNSKTSTTSSRDNEDSHSDRRREGSHGGRKRPSAPSSSGGAGLPDNVTDVVKAPLGQSMHSQNNSSVSDDESFVEFSDEGELFDEERKAPPISQRAATGFHSSTQSMDSSFGASFASFGEEEDEFDHQQVLVEVPEL